VQLIVCDDQSVITAAIGGQVHRSNQLRHSRVLLRLKPASARVTGSRASVDCRQIDLAPQAVLCSCHQYASVGIKQSCAICQAALRIYDRDVNEWQIV
jgi:hypothetical protein